MAQHRSAALMTGSGVDPVTLEIIRGGLRAVQSEMEVLIERTAMSPFIREKKDYASGLYAADGRMIAGKALPFASDLVTPIFEEYPPETMKRGSFHSRQYFAAVISSAMLFICIAPSPTRAITGRSECAYFAASA